MLREAFSGRNPSHYQTNPIVKAYIISESFIWSGYNFTSPIIAIFIVSQIPGATIELAATSFSVYLVSRVIFELVAGKMLLKADDKKRIVFSIIGLFILAISYVGFAFAREIMLFFFFKAIAGLGLGLATPAKNSLFALHLDKNKEATEWGISDAIVYVSIALATALGGFIASVYGFQLLFLLAAVITLLSIFPYVLYLNVAFTEKSANR